MTQPAVFGLSVLMSFVAFGIVTRLYIWPRLHAISREDALIALTVPHTFRFVGLSFLVPVSYRPCCHRLSPLRRPTAISWRPFSPSSQSGRSLPMQFGPFRLCGCSTYGVRLIS